MLLATIDPADVAKGIAEFANKDFQWWFGALLAIGLLTIGSVAYYFSQRYNRLEEKFYHILDERLSEIPKLTSIIDQHTKVTDAFLTYLKTK